MKQASHRHVLSCWCREGSAAWAAGVRALHVPRGQLWGGDTQTGNTLSTAEQCVGVSWPHVGWDGVVLGTVMGLGAQCRYVSTVNVTGASSPSGDGEGSACSDGALLAHMCMCGGTNSCRTSMCGAAPLLWAWGPVMSCIPLTSWPDAPCPAAVPCTLGRAVLGERRGPGLNQA